jgi:hypothetical protein
LVCTVITGRDFIEALWIAGVPGEEGIDVTDGFAEILIHPRDEPRPQGSYSASAAQYLEFSIQADTISRMRIGVSGNIGNSPATKPFVH